MLKNFTVEQAEDKDNKNISHIPKKSEILAAAVIENGKDGVNMGKDKGAVEGFGRYLSEDGKSWKTIESYVGDVAGFLAYLERMETEFDGELKRFQITSYRSHLLEEGYEASTINKKINSLQAFNRWLVDSGTMTDTVVDLRKDKVKVANGSEKQVEVLSEKQLERLLFCIQGQKVCVRDKAVVLCLLYTGVRVSELCSIKAKHIDFLTGHIRVAGKGGKLREVPMKPEVTEAVKQYLTERASNKHSGSEYLFLGQRGPLQRDAVNTLLEKLTMKTHMDVRLKPHTFRHYVESKIMGSIACK